MDLTCGDLQTARSSCLQVLSLVLKVTEGDWERTGPKLHQTYQIAQVIRGMEYTTFVYKERPLYEMAVAVSKKLTLHPTVCDVLVENVTVIYTGLS